MTLHRTTVFLCAAALLLTPGLASAQSEEEIADQNHVNEPIPPNPEGTGIQCDTGFEPMEIYFSDFEANDGGWAGAGVPDWEWGAPVLGVFELCDSPEPEPTGPFSGANVWATNLNGCYTNSGSTATLTQTFDLTGVEAPIELSLWHWLHVFGSFDTADLTVNGDLLFEETSSNPTADWTFLAVPLDAYAGMASVTVEFNVNATTVVNRSGWYLDDVRIEGCVLIPVELQSFEIE